MKYYDLNSKVFIDNTLNVDMSSLYERFKNYIPSGGKILDLGCGPGRDVKAFIEMGFSCIGAEPSVKLREFALEYTASEILDLKAEDLSYKNEFDGVWSCASLLHVSKDQIVNVLNRIQEALKLNGAAYISFKYGDFSGERPDGRFFMDMTEQRFEKAVAEVSGLSIKEMWTTSDLRTENSTKWLNIIVQKD